MTASQPQQLGPAGSLALEEQPKDEENAFPARLSLYWPVIAVVAGFLATLFVIPVMVDAPVSDDWVYTRSVEILLDTGHLKIFDLAVVTLVFQVVWGAIFTLLFGDSFGALRLSTIAIVAISAIAFYGTCRELRLSRGRSAIGTAAYLFNPLVFGLAFSFMTDPHFLALLVIATYFYVRGLQIEAIDRRMIIAGSFVASLAFLVRQQGALIPLAVGVYLVLSRRWKPNLAGLKMAAWVAGLPTLTLALYYAWLFHTGAPAQQNAFLNQMTGAGWASTRLLFERMTFIEVMYIGFFIAPLIVALIPGALHWRMPRNWAGMIAFITFVAILITGLQVFGTQGRRMPYIPQFASSTGIGPTDLIGGPLPRVIAVGWLEPLTIFFAVTAFLFALLTTSQIGLGSKAERGGPGLLLSIGLFQVLGIMPPSFHFRNWIISVDRYLVPMVPFAILLLLWATRNLRLFTPLAWLAIAAYAFFSIAGTRDFLVFQGATWDMGRQAVQMGVPLTRLDAGSSWDGYYLYEYSIENHIKQQTRHGPWWTNLFAPATDSTYIVSTRPIEGYDVIAMRQYSSWLKNGPQMIYLSRKHTYPGPP